MHADFVKIKKVVEESQDLYQNKGLIRDLDPKPRFGLSDNLEYSHIKKKPKIVPVEEKKEEIEEDKDERDEAQQALGAGSLKYQTKAERIAAREVQKEKERGDKVRNLETQIKRT